MDVIINILFILTGFFLLIKGGDYLVEGAVAIARRARLSPMVIGLTVIGFGTSAPELLVSTMAAIDGSPGIAIGNVVGSNIANIGLILGVASMIIPLSVSRFTLHVDTPFMIAATALLAIAGMCGTIWRWEGLIGVIILTSYIAWQIRLSRKKPQPKEENEPEPMNIWMALVIVMVSIAALAIGANLLIKGASGMAMTLGTTLGVAPAEMERIIGLTIVAAGTSLPELFATVIAAKKGQVDMAIGNIIGSVTFNIYSVVGIASIVCPIHNADAGFFFDYIVMVGIGVILWIFLRTKYTLERWEGIILTLLYILYLLRTVLI